MRSSSAARAALPYLPAAVAPHSALVTDVINPVATAMIAVWDWITTTVTDLWFRAI